MTVPAPVNSPDKPGPASRGLRLIRGLRSRPRLLSSIACGALVYALLRMAGAHHAESAVLLAWNAGALLYLLLVGKMAFTHDHDGMRRRALRQDEGRTAVLALTTLAAAAVLLAVGSQLASVKELPPAARSLHVALAAATVMTSWLFTQTLFALHYAHDFYIARLHGQPDPLLFPGTTEPTYRDFLYFACIIGTSGQTADVSFSGSRLRGVGTLHCVVAFFFNATLLALAINIAAGLL